MLELSNSELINECDLLQSAIGFRVIHHEIGLFEDLQID